MNEKILREINKTFPCQHHVAQDCKGVCRDEIISFVAKVLCAQKQEIKRMIAERMQGKYQDCAHGFVDLLIEVEKP